MTTHAITVRPLPAVSARRTGRYRLAVAVLVLSAADPTRAADFWWGGGANEFLDYAQLNANETQVIDTNWFTAGEGPQIDPLRLPGINDDMKFAYFLSIRLSTSLVSSMQARSVSVEPVVRGNVSVSGAKLFVGSGGISMNTARTLTINSPLGTATGTSVQLFNINDPAGSILVNGAMIGTQSLTKSGPGPLTLSGSNTYTGGTKINGGLLTLSSAAALPSGRNVSIGAGTLDINGNSVTLGNLNFDFGTTARTLTNSGNPAATVTLNGGINFNRGTGDTLVQTRLFLPAGQHVIADPDTFGFEAVYAPVFSAPISGPGGLTKTGSFLSTAIAAPATYTGPTVISGGTLAVAAVDALPIATAVTLGSATLRLNPVAATGVIAGSYNQTIGSLASTASDSNILLGAATLTVGDATSTTFAGLISGTAGSKLTKQGAGTLTLTRNAALTNPTTITLSAGTLQIGDGGNSGSMTSPITNNASLIFNRSGSLTHSAFISGTGSLTKLGTGTLILDTATSYSGPTVISAGILELNANGFINSTSSITIGNAPGGAPATFRLTGSDRFGNSTVTSTVPLTVAATGTLASAGTYNTLVNLNLAGGTVLLNGGLFSDFPAFGLKGTLSVSGSQPSQILTGTGINNAINIGPTNAPGSLTMSVADVTASSAADLTVATVLQNNALESGGTNVSALTKTGAGTLLLTAANTYSGPTLISSGTLQLGNGGTTGSVAGNITNNANLVFNRAGDSSYAGTISGTGNTSLTAGKLILLSSINTPTGDLLLSTNTAVDFAAPRSTSPILVSTLDNLSIPTAATAKLTPSPRNNGTQQAVLILNSLTLSGTGFLDLTNNDLIFRNQSLASTRALVATWLTSNNGLPGNIGLGSSESFYTVNGAFTTLAVYDNSIAGQTLSTFDGIPVLPSDILVKYTYLGDTNLDGVVDATDLSRLLAGMNGQGSGWNFGDINYDGQINFTDLGRTLAALRGQAAPLGNSALANGGVIPEPTSLALLAPAALALLRLPRATSRGHRTHR